MANVKITGLTAYTDPVSTDVLPIVDVSNDATKKVSIADLLENAGTGSAAAPSFSFDGDNNTGIYRPGEDQIAISTNGTQRLSINSAGLASFANNVTIEGDLTVNGATTTIDSTTLIVEDKNIEMGSVTTPTDSTADGGGITLKGATDKTINWINSTDAWTLSEHVNIASAKEFRIAGTKVLDATSLGSAVVSSSLTSVGTIGTGVWNGTAIASAYIADSAITSAKIADGAIVNADVNASAAIAGSKITTGTTSAVGVLQLTDSTSSTSTTTAATPNSVKTAYDLANAALPKAGGTLTGDLTIPDKIIHSGDTNTFIRFPAADTFSVDTAGSERLRIDSSGNVLIGGTLPSSPNIELNANGLAEFASSVNVGPFVNGSTRGFRLGVGSVGATLNIQAEAGISSATSFMQCKTGADEKFVLKTNGSAEFAGNLTIADKIIHNGDTNTAVRFPANDTVSVETAGSERLRIDSSGDVLFFGNIRKDNASSSLTVSGGNGSSSGANIVLNGQSGSPGNTIQFRYGSNESMRIDSSGNVGIGTTSPATALEVQSASNTSIRIDNEDDSTATLVFHNTGSTDRQISVTAGEMKFGGTSNEQMRIDSSGNVGIGTSSPGSYSSVANNLVVQDTAGEGGITIVSTTTGSSNIFFADTDSTSQGQIKYQHSGDYMRFYTANAERLRIDSSGRLLVGTSSARSNLFTSVSPQSQVEGTDVSTSSLGLTCNNTNAGGTPILAFGKSAGSSVGSNTLVSNNHKLGQIDFLGNNGSNFISGARINAEVDGTPGSNDMPGRIVLATTADGASSPTERMRIDSSGKVGIGLTPTAPLHVGGTIQSQTGSSVAQMYADGGSANFTSVGAYPALFHVNGSERMRIDSSGRLLVGTSTSTQNVSMIAQGSSAGSSQRAQAILALGASNPADGATLGILSYSDSGHAPAAWVFAARDGGTWTSGTSQPTRLVFATTADGASSPTERMRINSSGEINCPGVYTDTTALAANVRVGVAGGLQRSTSSIKYKTSVETLENSYADALLSCRPVWYKSKCASDDPTWGHWGFIAEEVAEIDPRLVHWKTSDVSYDENGSIVETASEPEPEGVQYDRFVPHLLNLIKRQQAAIETLEAKVTALESA